MDTLRLPAAEGNNKCRARKAESEGIGDPSRPFSIYPCLSASIFVKKNFCPLGANSAEVTKTEFR